MTLSAESVRESAVAGRFYPASATVLSEFIAGALDDDQATCAETGTVDAVVVPHAGYQFSGETAGKGFALLREGQYRRAIIMGPSHVVPFRGVAVAPFGSFRTPLGDVTVDRAACEMLLAADSAFTVSGEAHTPEHSIEVELPFLQTVAPECQIVPLVFGELDSDLINRVARHLLTLWDDETVVVVSSDFTHYGESFNYLPFSPEAAPTKLEELDAGAIDRILEQDTQGFMDYVSETGATICGRLPIAVLLAAMSDRDIDCKATLLQYTNSGRILNDYRNSVSYAAIAFRRDCDVGDGGAPALTQEDRKCLFGIVRGTIEGVLYSRPYALPESLPKRLLQTRATFVTLRKHGELRGCIGGTSATEPLPECLQASALGAAFKDPRFPPLTADEWPDVTIAISVLSEARPIDGADNFEPGRHGIIMEYKDKHAVFLPKVAVDHGWDRGTTLSYLSKKAGLARDAWRSDAARFHVFEADEFSEGEGAG